MKKKKPKDAYWVLRQIRKHLPLGGFCSTRTCECSADIVYYLNQIEEKLRNNK